MLVFLCKRGIFQRYGWFGSFELVVLYRKLNCETNGLLAGLFVLFFVVNCALRSSNWWYLNVN